jgi:nucleoside 2-deoxyribosyltransferase
LAWIEQSDGLIAEVTNPSCGVGYETHYALLLNKPVLALYGKTNGSKRISAMIEGSTGKYKNMTIFNYDRSPKGIEKAKKRWVIL